MNKQHFIEEALAAGIEDIELFERHSKSTVIKVFDQKVDSFEISQCNSMRIRGIYQHTMGSCFIEEDNDELIPYIIETIKQNAQAITSRDEVEIYAGDKEYPVVEYCENTCLNTAVEDKIILLKKLEIALKNSDSRIDQVMKTAYQDSEGSIQITNSKGVNIAHKEACSLLMASILVKDGDDQKSAYDVTTLSNMNDFDMEQFVETLRKKAVDQLHGEPIASKSYPILLHKDAMGSMLQCLTGLFDGENAYKGISLLKGKLGQKIFDDKITIIDNPLLKDGMNSAPFDDEGVACYEKVIVQQGVLSTYLLDLKAAKFMKDCSTGNGFNGGVSPSNLYIMEGYTSYEDLIKRMDCGVIITEINGLHAGLNAITTEFSLQASGFYVEGGIIVKPVNLITIAGNFLQLMKDVTAVGNDLKFQLSGIGAPSVLFPNMAISGK